MNHNIVYERKYFGPITLDRLGIKLLDDKGNLLNLHGHNYDLFVTVKGHVKKKDGFVCNLKDLSSLIRDCIINKFPIL